MARTFAEPVTDDHHPSSCQVRSDCSTPWCSSPRRTTHSPGGSGKCKSPHWGQLHAHSVNTHNDYHCPSQAPLISNSSPKPFPSLYRVGQGEHPFRALKRGGATCSCYPYLPFGRQISIFTELNWEKVTFPGSHLIGSSSPMCKLPKFPRQILVLGRRVGSQDLRTS